MATMNVFECKICTMYGGGCYIVVAHDEKDAKYLVEAYAEENDYTVPNFAIKCLEGLTAPADKRGVVGGSIYIE